MAATGANYDTLYRVIGAGGAVAANRRVAQSFTRAGQANRALTSGLLGMRSALTGNMLAIGAIGLALQRATSSYAQYTSGVARMNTTLAAQVVNHRSQTRLVRDVSEGAARQFGYSTTESNDAMNTMLQTGLGTHRAMRVFGTSLQLARVANMDTGHSVQFLTDTMNMFRTEQARAGESSQEFARRMSSQLIVSANMASTSIAQLQQAFRYAGGEMSALGYSSSDTISALASLSSIGLRGTTAGTRLRGAIAALHTPTSTTRRMFEEFGVESTRLNQILYHQDGTLRRLAGSDGAMTQLMNVVQDLPTQQARNTAMFRLFGRRAQAAGASLAGMTEAGERAARIGDRLQRDDVVSGSILDETSRVQMRSFGMQVQQLKEGVRDLGITFGETLFNGLGNSERGFGTVFREMVRGIRLAGTLNNMTKDQEREWEGMSQETRNQAVAYRELLDTAVVVLRFMGQAIGFIARMASEYPRLTAALIVFRVAMGGPLMMAAFRGFGTMLTGTSAYLQRTATLAAGASWQMQAMRLAVMGLGMHVAGLVTSAFQRMIVGAMGMTGELQSMNSGIQEYLTMVETIPAVGPLASQLIQTANAANEARREYDRYSQRVEADNQRLLAASGGEIIEAAMDRRRRSGNLINGSEELTRVQVARQTSGTSANQAASLMYASGLRTADAVTARLASAGISGRQLTDTTNRILAYQRTAGHENLIREARHMASGTGSWLTKSASFAVGGEGRAGDYSEALEQNVSQLSTFSTALESATRALRNIGTPQTAGDAIINRSGVIRATAGDVLVNRASLADAITSAPGGMTSDIIGQRQHTAGSPASGGSGGGGSGDIVIQIDGREIARAVGRQHATHLERSGVSIQPGQRRTMRESGFSERLG